MAKPSVAFDPDELRFRHSGGVERRQVWVHDGKRGEMKGDYAVKAADVLQRLHRRGSLGTGGKFELAMAERRYQAATAWATDYEWAGMGVVVVASYAGPVAPGVGAVPEMRLRAVERFRSGYRAMGDRGGSLAWAVVIDNMDLSAWAHNHRVSRDYASERLREAFDDLAGHYGIPAPKST